LNFDTKNAIQKYISICLDRIEWIGSCVKTSVVLSRLNCFNKKRFLVNFFQPEFEKVWLDIKISTVFPDSRKIILASLYCSFS
jgi:hypothetical protein